MNIVVLKHLQLLVTNSKPRQNESNGYGEEKCLLQGSPAEESLFHHNTKVLFPSMLDRYHLSSQQQLHKPKRNSMPNELDASSLKL